MTKLGMDIEQGRALAKTLKAEGDKVGGIAAALAKQVNAVDWTGVDATKFKGSDWKGAETLLKNAIANLGQLSEMMTKHVTEQETASKG